MMRRKWIVLLCIVNLVACVPKENNAANRMMFGIIKTTSNTNNSVISFYDENLSKIKDIHCKAGELGTNFSQAVYLNNKAFIVPRGIVGKYDDKKVVGIDMNKLTLNEYTIDRINLQKVSVTQDSIFVTSNLNFTNYLSKIDFNSNLQDELTSENYMELVVCAGDKICLFESNQSTSYIKIYNKELKLLKEIDISKIGNQHAKYTIWKNKLIFSNAYINNMPNNTISILDLDTYEIKTIELKYQYPNDLLIYDNQLIISHTSDVDPQGNMLSIVNLSDFSVEKEVKLDVKVMRLDLYKNNLLVLSPKDEKNISRIFVYDLKNNFKQTDNLELNLKDNEYHSCIFTNQDNE